MALTVRHLLCDRCAFSHLNISNTCVSWTLNALHLVVSNTCIVWATTKTKTKKNGRRRRRRKEPQWKDRYRRKEAMKRNSEIRDAKSIILEVECVRSFCNVLLFQARKRLGANATKWLVKQCCRRLHRRIWWHCRLLHRTKWRNLRARALTHNTCIKNVTHVRSTHLNDDGTHAVTSRVRKRRIDDSAGRPKCTIRLKGNPNSICCDYCWVGELWCDNPRLCRSD